MIDPSNPTNKNGREPCSGITVPINLSNMLHSSFQFAYLSSLVWLTYKIGVSSFWTTPINVFPALCYLTLQWRIHMSDMKCPSRKERNDIVWGFQNRKQFFYTETHWAACKCNMLFWTTYLPISCFLICFSKSWMST